MSVRARSRARRLRTERAFQTIRATANGGECHRATNARVGGASLRVADQGAPLLVFAPAACGSEQARESEPSRSRSRSRSTRPRISVRWKLESEVVTSDRQVRARCNSASDIHGPYSEELVLTGTDADL